MSIKKRIYTSLLLSTLLAIAMFFTMLYFIFSHITEGRIKESYETIHKSYKDVINHEKEKIEYFSIKSHKFFDDEMYYYKKLQGGSCDEVSYYRVLSSGLYFGVNRLYVDGCYFVGFKLEEVLKLIKNLLGVDWVIYYYRDPLKSLLEGSMDSFMKGKVVIGDAIIDSFSDPKALYMPLDVKGYRIYGSFLEKSLLVEVPITYSDGTPVGRIIFIKDVSYIYEITYLIFLILGLYSLLMFFSLGFMLFRIASGLVRRVIFLRNITASIEKRDFSVVELLKDDQGGTKDEIWWLKHSIYNMAVSLKHAFEELEEKQRKLEELAYYDPLTGLPNRRFFFDHANLILESAKRYKSPLSLLIIDLDHFKKINDTYGHEAGDLLLKSFADVLRKNSRKSDLPARLGGEEFALLMPNTNLHQAKVVAERIRKSLQNSVIVYKEKEIRTTLSGGLASLEPDMENIDDLMRAADEALYKAKELGRNRIEVYGG